MNKETAQRYDLGIAIDENEWHSDPQRRDLIDAYQQGFDAAWEHQSAELDALRREVKARKAAVRYALATFRALDQYTFDDSDHGLLIAEAVKKLEGAEFAALEGESR